MSTPSVRYSQLSDSSGQDADPEATSRPPVLQISHAQSDAPPSPLSRPVSPVTRPGPNPHGPDGDSHFSQLYDKFRHFSAPWIHDGEGTTKYYDRHSQRHRLLANSTFQWFITAALCAATVGCLKGFENLHGLDVAKKRIFNAVITGLSLGIGINLVSSLRSYANMMRWRLLATGWWSIQEFDLILGAESQTNVLRLLWLGTRTRRKFPYILSRTQVICVLWLSVNFAAVILPALLGLTFSIDDSSQWDLTTYGNATVVDLTTIYYTDPESEISLSTQEQAAQAFGIIGQTYSIDLDMNASDQYEFETIYTSDYTDFIVRFFDNAYANDGTELSVASGRYVETYATCTQYHVVQDAVANGTDITYTNVEPNGSTITASEYIDEFFPGSTTYISDTNNTCGDRCSSIIVYQAADNVTIDSSAFFRCNSTVSDIECSYSDDPDCSSATFQFPETQARIWAGSIALTGVPKGKYQRQWQIYGGDWSSDTTPLDNTTTAQYLMEFSAFGLAAYDQNGPTITAWGLKPLKALQLSVEWKWAISLLAIIPGLQFIVYFFVVGWANKAIIKDDSYLSIAKLLQPVVARLGDGGCILTGEDIASSEHLKDERVAYGYHDPNAHTGDIDRVRHLDVIFQDKEDSRRPTIERAWPDGRYNGPGKYGSPRRHRRLSI